ncbi:hypothetical protein PB2503_12124 [Parvularcula bermudensis HTCC2503]|uniref:Peptidase M28 domain-containing protein n=2 Tax=Parvularcula TaxID=208215 RepID=E0TEJ5_PARBH|nr:hypothetical protein PB2503_12124 [Parvularcula bermudensis HTCC2503]
MFFLFPLLLVAACGGADAPSAPDPVDTLAVPSLDDEEETAVPMDVATAPPTEGAPSLPDIEEATLRGALSVLASDAFNGRAPASSGGEKTRKYLIDQMEQIGLTPANDGDWEQKVGLVEQAIIPSQSSLSFSLPTGTDWQTEYGEETMYWTKRVQRTVSFDESEVVFVGFGIVAPEYGWNDYEGLDVEGKTVVMLVNDPGFYQQDEAFNGRAMTYYGRWTYKYEEAARQGAAAALIVHETAPAAYGWGVVSGSWSGPQLDLERQDKGMNRVALEGWLSLDAANRLFEAAGHSYEDLKQRALSPDFRAIPFDGVSAEGTLKNVINRNESANIAGMIEGTERPDEMILYIAHWDHLGAGFSGTDGDQRDTIHNGAVDNATGTAGLLAIAESFANAEVPPERSLLFLAVTAEESGLLGSAYFADDPFVPLDQIVGGINMDAIQPTGPAHDLLVIGYGASELEDILKTVADDYGKRLRPDDAPEKGYFYRSDHISLAKTGVPMIYVDQGVDLIEGGEEAGRAFVQDYIDNRYHKPADEYDTAWRVDGLAEVFTILRDVGVVLAYGEDWPNWYEGNEFRSLRDAQRTETAD